MSSLKNFVSLQKTIIYMNEVEALDIFKQSLKYRIQKKMMVSNSTTIIKAIAQQILDAYDVI